MALTRQRMGARVTRETEDGYYVNPGNGMPTLCANYVLADPNVKLESGNALLAIGPWPADEEIDADRINAGQMTVIAVPEASFRRGRGPRQAGAHHHRPRAEARRLENPERMQPASDWQGVGRPVHHLARSPRGHPGWVSAARVGPATCPPTRPTRRPLRAGLFRMAAAGTPHGTLRFYVHPACWFPAPSGAQPRPSRSSTRAWSPMYAFPKVDVASSSR